jgi:hypothetical protein
VRSRTVLSWKHIPQGLQNTAGQVNRRPSPLSRKQFFRVDPREINMFGRRAAKEGHIGNSKVGKTKQTNITRGEKQPNVRNWRKLFKASQESINLGKGKQKSSKLGHPRSRRGHNTSRQITSQGTSQNECKHEWE